MLVCVCVCVCVCACTRAKCLQCPRHYKHPHSEDGQVETQNGSLTCLSYGESENRVSAKSKPRFYLPREKYPLLSQASIPQAIPARAGGRSHKPAPGASRALLGVFGQKEEQELPTCR